MSKQSLLQVSYSVLNYAYPRRSKRLSTINYRLRQDKVEGPITAEAGDRLTRVNNPKSHPPFRPWDSTSSQFLEMATITSILDTDLYKVCLYVVQWIQWKTDNRFCAIVDHAASCLAFIPRYHCWIQVYKSLQKYDVYHRMCGSYESSGREYVLTLPPLVALIMYYYRAFSASINTWRASMVETDLSIFYRRVSCLSLGMWRDAVLVSAWSSSVL